MPETLWKLCDAGDAVHLRSDTKVLYLREYIVAGGYDASPTNSHISNIKRSPNAITSKELYWRRRSIDHFRRELQAFLASRPAFEVWLVPAARSKPKVHPNWNDSIDNVCELVAKNLDHVHFCPCVEVGAARPAQHEGGDRSPEARFDELALVDGVQLPPPKARVLYVDDVFTTGATMEGARRFFEEQITGVAFFGLVWAKAIWT